MIIFYPWFFRCIGRIRSETYINMKKKPHPSPWKRVKNITPFHFKTVFELQAILRYIVNAPKDPQIILNATSSKVLLPVVCWVPNFSFTLQPGVFWVNGHFKTSAPNKPQITNTIRSKIPHICFISVSGPKFQSTLLYSLPLSKHWRFWARCLNYRPFWDKRTEWSQIDLEHQRHPIYMLQLPQTPKFRSFSPYGQLFSKLYAILRQVHRMTPKLPRTLKDQRYPT